MLVPSSSLFARAAFASSFSSSSSFARRRHHRPPAIRIVRSIVTHISSTTSLLRSNTTDNEVYLLGTAHVSESSTREVVDLIRLVQPRVVFLELDSSRASKLREDSSSAGGGGGGGGGGASSNSSGGHDDAASSSPFHVSNMMASSSNNNPFLSALEKIHSNPDLASFNRMLAALPALLKRIGWFPPMGGEMRAALEEADRIPGARCVYGDVEFSRTMAELQGEVGAILTNPARLASVPPPPSGGELGDLFGALLAAGGGGGGGQEGDDLVRAIEAIKTRENAEQMTTYLRRCFPSVYDVMITKRDVHMAGMLRRHCAEGKVVAVVGMAHVEGIEREWEEQDTA